MGNLKDKIIKKVSQLIFLKYLYGFCSNKNYHTVLRQIQKKMNPYYLIFVNCY